MIFISYRRSEDAGFAGRLFDRLESTFRREALFMDVDSIPPGEDFVAILKEQVAKCDVLLALIGRGWLTATDEAGCRRLNNAEDFVRIEIETALTRRKRVIPVLIDDVPMPRAEELPEELKLLVCCHAIRLSHDRFRADCDRLIRALEQVLADLPTKTGKPPFKAAWERIIRHVRMPDWQMSRSRPQLRTEPSLDGSRTPPASRHSPKRYWRKVQSAWRACSWVGSLTSISA